MTKTLFDLIHFMRRVAFVRSRSLGSSWRHGPLPCAGPAATGGEDSSEPSAAPSVAEARSFVEAAEKRLLDLTIKRAALPGAA